MKTKKITLTALILALALCLAAGAFAVYAAWTSGTKNAQNTLSVGTAEISLDKEGGENKYFSAVFDAPRESAFTPADYSEAVAAAEEDNGATIAQAQITLTRTEDMAAHYTLALDDSAYNNNRQMRGNVFLTCYEVKDGAGTVTAWAHTRFSEAQPLAGSLSAGSVTYHLFLTAEGGFTAGQDFTFDLVLESRIPPAHDEMLAYSAEDGTTYDENGTALTFADHAGQLVELTMQAYLDSDAQGTFTANIAAIADGTASDVYTYQASAADIGVWKEISFVVQLDESGSCVLTGSSGSSEGEAFIYYLKDIAAAEVAPLTVELAGSDFLATTSTYSGAANTAGTTAQLTVYNGETPVEVSSLTFTSSDTGIVTVGADGTVNTTGKAGMTTITVTGELCRGEIHVEVFTAMNCKRDFDMLALADALGKTEDWNSGAEYILTQNIDYNNALWIPIAAESTLHGNPGVATGVQFESVLTSGNYGIEYLAFAQAGGLNPDNRSFNATIDGNGYAISNAKVMGDAYVDHSATATFKWNVFGNFGGTLTNIGFENFTVQQQSEVDPFYASKTETAYNTSGSPVALTGGLRSGFAVASGFIAVNTGTIQDLYVDFDIPGGNAFTAMSGGSWTNAFIIDNRGGTIERVVVNWNWNGKRESYQTRLFELNSGTISGVIAVWPMATSGSFTLVRTDGQNAATNFALFASADAYTAEGLDLSGFTKWDVSGSGLPVLKGAARA